METEIIETVLTDLLDEQKASNQLNRELTEKVGQLEKKVESFQEMLGKQKIIAPLADLAPVEKMVDQHMQAIHALVESQPKNVIRQVRLLLFPETNAGQYYRIVFGRLIPWTLGLILATYGFSLGQQYIQESSAIHERQLVNDQCFKAWNYLYKHQPKEGKKTMEEAWEKTLHGSK